jgi:hypothetical protein
MKGEHCFYWATDKRECVLKQQASQRTQADTCKVQKYYPKKESTGNEILRVGKGCCNYLDY